MDRAKRFLSQKSRAIATTIVPLAGLVLSQMPAMAVNQGPGFSSGAPCNISPLGSNVGTSGGCSVAQEGATDPTSGLLGVKLVGGEFEPFAFSGSGGTFGLNITAIGSATGLQSYTGTIPVSWDFTPTSSDGGNLSYLLTFTLSPQGTQLPGQIQTDTVALGSTLTEGDLSSFTVTSGSTVSGTAAFNLANASIGSYTINLQVEESTGCCEKSLTVNIPTNSLDLAPLTGTPEPASIVLTGVGLAGLFFRRRRRPQH
jgi:hypothetical protein